MTDRHDDVTSAVAAGEPATALGVPYKAASELAVQQIAMPRFWPGHFLLLCLFSDELVLHLGFYEWRHEGKAKLPHFIRIREGLPLLFAGLLESWKAPEGEMVESFTILTTAASRLLEPIHERMPVILHPAECGRWLNRAPYRPAPLSVFFQPYPADLLERWQVSPIANPKYKAGN